MLGVEERPLEPAEQVRAPAEILPGAVKGLHARLVGEELGPENRLLVASVAHSFYKLIHATVLQEPLLAGFVESRRRLRESQSRYTC